MGLGHLIAQEAAVAQGGGVEVVSGAGTTVFTVTAAHA
jgi:hypothetical protein